jgi:hypothetical protein
VDFIGIHGFFKLVLYSIVHEKRDKNFECLRKCLHFIKIALQIDELACGIANEWKRLVCGSGKSLTNFGSPPFFLI